jgi:hypothetical protein
MDTSRIAKRIFEWKPKEGDQWENRDWDGWTMYVMT